MPDLTSDVSEILATFFRCRSNKCLPHEGGLLDQPAWLMDYFDVIDSAEAKYRHRKAEELRRAQTRERLKNG